MSIKAKYISYGKYETGGYKHELFFAHQLAQFLTTEHEKCELIIERSNRFFENPFAYLKLFLLGLKANGNYNIVVARVAVFAMLRNLFTKNKVYIVLHNFDEDDGKSIWLKWYYHLLFFLLKNLPTKNISIVAVAPFWVNYFKNRINGNIPVHLFPNFFDVEYYDSFNLIHMRYISDSISDAEKKLPLITEVFIILINKLNYFVDSINLFRLDFKVFIEYFSGFIEAIEILIFTKKNVFSLFPPYDDMDKKILNINNHISQMKKLSIESMEYTFKINNHLDIMIDNLYNPNKYLSNDEELVFELNNLLVKINQNYLKIEKYLKCLSNHIRYDDDNWDNVNRNYGEAGSYWLRTYTRIYHWTINSGFKNYNEFSRTLEGLYFSIEKTKGKKTQIHLGQWSFKNDPDVFEVAKQLTAKGYYCYFSTNFKDFAKKTNDYEVVYFEQFEDYLVQMAISEFTLALTGINEGWNRVAHESILVGTPVIAYAKAGLLDLVNESKSYAAVSVADVLQAIENKNIQAEPSLLSQYDIRNSQEYIRHFFS